MNIKVTSRLIFAGLLACSFVGCTSSDSKTDDQVAATDDSNAVDQELEKLDGEEAAQAKNTTDDANSSLGGDQSTDQALTGNDPLKSDVAVADAPPPPDASTTPLPTELAPSDSTALPPTDIAQDTPSAIPTESKPAVVSSLKKVEAAPFKRHGELLNAVYIARPGDTYKSIAMMIYGSDEKAKTLKKSNPSLSKPKPGDKVYYNSPQRPTDDTIVKNYYEDANIPSQSYVGQNGDNLKKVAKNLLGYDQAWKEVWVTNAIDSKSKLEEGEVIHYWPAGTATAAAGAPATPGMGSESAQLPPPSPTEASNGFNGDAQATPDMPLPPPPSPAPDMSTAANSPAGGMNGNAMGQNTGATDLPPPAPVTAPTMDATPSTGSIAKTKTSGTQDNDELMLGLAAVGILVAGGAALIIIRKRRQQRAMANAFNDTQIGTG